MIREQLAAMPRPWRVVELPGGGSIKVRSVSLAELDRADQLAEQLADVGAQNVRRAVVIAGCAVGLPAGTDAEVSELVEAVGWLTPDQLEAICAAAVSSKAEAKNV